MARRPIPPVKRISNSRLRYRIKVGEEWTHGVGHFGRRNDRECSHHPIWELFSDLGDQERSHTGSGTTSERVGDLETLARAQAGRVSIFSSATSMAKMWTDLELVASFGFLADDIENAVDEFGSLCTS